MADDEVMSRRIHGTVARAIGIEIMGGARQPGDVLGGEIEASEALGISRTAYREAIRILAAKGLVESRPKAGTRILPRARWNLLDPEVLAWAFDGEPPDHFVRDLFELRAVIEPAACSFAALRRDEDDLAVMREALQEMRLHGLATGEGRAADQRFHRAILTAARNEPLGVLASSVGAAVSWTTVFKHRRWALPRDPLPDHIAVFEAVEAGKSDAAGKAMRELLRLALADMDLPRKF